MTPVVFALVLTTLVPAKAPETVVDNLSTTSLARLWSTDRDAMLAEPENAPSAALEHFVESFVRSGWNRAYVWSRVLAQDAVALAQKGAHVRAEQFAAASARLDEVGAQGPWAQTLVAWHEKQALSAAGWAAKAVVAWFSTPQGRAAFGVGALVASMVGWAVALAFLSAPLLLGGWTPFCHWVGHALPPSWSDKPAAKRGITVALLLASVLLRLGPVGWTVVVGASIAACLPSRERRQFASVLAVTALLVATSVVPVRLWQAQAGMGQERYWATQDASAQWARQALSRQPATALKSWADGLVALADADAKASVAHLRAAQGRGLSSAELELALGAGLYLQLDYEKAAEAFRRALELRPQWPLAMFNLSQTLLGLAQPVEADRARAAAFSGGGRRLLAAVAQAERRGQPLLWAPAAPQLYQDADTDGAMEERNRLGRSAIEQAFGPLTGRIAWSWTVVLAGLLAFVLGTEALWRHTWGLGVWIPSPCHRCGTVICRQCSPDHTQWGLCSGCAALAQAPETMEPARRIQQQLAGHRHVARQRRIWRALGVVAPGLGLAFQGFWLLGACHIAAMTVLGLLWALSVGWLPAWSPVWLSGPGLLWPGARLVVFVLALLAWGAGRSLLSRLRA